MTRRALFGALLPGAAAAQVTISNNTQTIVFPEILQNTVLTQVTGTPGKYMLPTDTYRSVAVYRSAMDSSGSMIPGLIRANGHYTLNGAVLQISNPVDGETVMVDLKI